MLQGNVHAFCTLRHSPLSPTFLIRVAVPLAIWGVTVTHFVLPANNLSSALTPHPCIPDCHAVTPIRRAPLLPPSSAQRVQRLFILLQQMVILKSSSPFYIMAHVRTVQTNVVSPLNFWHDITVGLHAPTLFVTGSQTKIVILSSARPFSAAYPLMNPSPSRNAVSVTAHYVHARVQNVCLHTLCVV